MSVRESLISIAPVAPGEALVVSGDESLRREVLRHMGTLAMRGSQAESCERAVEVAIAKTASLDCIVIDASLSEVWETLAKLRTTEETTSVPVVMITEHRPDDATLVKILESGAVDFIEKPIHGMLLVAKLRMVSERSRAARELRHKLQFALENAAHDALTGLFNRRYFERRLREESAHARRHKRPFSLVMLDIDHFKLVNDTYGHEDGDRVLRHLAEVVQLVLREDDVACRFGGEEFILLLRGTQGPAARVVANRLRAMLAEKPIDLGPKSEPRHVTFSAGVASADERNSFLVDDIVGRADAALYRAKKAGRNRVESEL